MKPKQGPEELRLRTPYRDYGVEPTTTDLPADDDPGPKSQERPSKRPSFQSAAAHFFGAAGRMTKTVTAILAVVSSALTFGSVAFAYWVAAWAKDFVQNTIAATNMEIHKVHDAVESQKMTISEMQRHQQLQDGTAYEHTKQIANIEGAIMSKRRGGSP